MSVIKLNSKSFFLTAAFCLTLAMSSYASAGELYKVRKLPSAKGGSSFAHSINKAGDAVGGTGAPHDASAVGMVWSGGGAAREINAAARSDYIQVLGINNKQQAVGSTNGQTAVQAFQWSPQSGIAFLPSLPDDNSSEAFAINDAGMIAGYSGGKSGLRAVLWTPGGIRNLGILPGGDHSEASALNSTGDAVGFSNSPAGSHAMLWLSSGTMTDLGTLPGDNSSTASAINDARQIVGSSQGDSGGNAFLWTESGGLQSLGMLPGGDYSYANGINNSGQVVGNSDSSLGQRAFVWKASAGMQDLNTLVSQKSNVILVDAVAINDAGQILVVGSTGHDLGHDRKVEIDASPHAGPTEIFLLTPVR